MQSFYTCFALREHVNADFLLHYEHVVACKVNSQEVKNTIEMHTNCCYGDLEWRLRNGCVVAACFMTTLCDIFCIVRSSIAVHSLYNFCYSPLYQNIFISKVA